MMRPSSFAFSLLVLTVACGGGSDTTSDAASASASGGVSSTGSNPASGAGSSSTAGMSGSGSATTTGAPGSSTAGSSSSTGESSTSAPGSSTGESSSSGGPACGGEQSSCAGGETCCPGLECCAGVPVPPGKEFCGLTCPISDRNLKTEFAEIDAAEVLHKVVALPITSWRYRKDDPAVRHIGPMAQDFHAAFGLWNSDTMIFPLDGSGVSMAAIQGLHARLVAAEAENEALRARLDRIERRLER